MLSYQHLYHAGNLADVQKHALLAFVLGYMTAKDKPLTYIETHAGRGLFDLGADEARKTGEAAAGIARIEPHLPKDHPYRRILGDTRALFGPAAYPGSPLIAALSLRPEDRLHLAELHPREHAALAECFAKWDARLYHRDGLDLAMALAPPTPRRGVLVIDPSYEVKEDYDRLPGLIGKLARKWNVGVIALWYPILTSGAHGPMLASLMAAHPGAFRHELRFAPIRPGHKMIGTGMFILNPPFGIEAEARLLSDAFAKAGV